MRQLLIALLCLLPIAAHGGAPLLRADDARLAVSEAKDAATPGSIAVRVALGGTTVQLDLAPNRRLEAEAAPFAPAIARGDDRLYAGAIAGRTGSWARLSRIGGDWIGLVFDGAELWYLEPARRHPALAALRGMAAGETLVHRGDDLDLPQGFDLHGLEPGPGAKGAHAAPHSGAPKGAPRYLKITLVLDTEFQTVYGASSASTAAAILNGVDGLYRVQTDIQVSLHHLRALASNGTLTSTDPNALLDAFTSFMPTSGIPFAGLAHLLSGKDFNGSTVGLAWVGTVCNTGFGYGIDQMTFSTAGSAPILAHEIGHNFSAQHDSTNNTCPSSGFVMGAVINLGSPPTQFSTCSLTYFNAFLAGPRACLDTPPPTAAVLFANGFEP